MRQKVSPGGSIDAVTSGEFQELLQRLELLYAQQKRTKIAAPAEGPTDGTGAASITVYNPPIGMEFRLTRLTISCASHSFAVPFTNAAGSVEIRRNGYLVDGFNLGQGIPNVGTDGSSQAAYFRNGDILQVIVTGGPPSDTLTVLAEGDLFPISHEVR